MDTANRLDRKMFNQLGYLDRINLEAKLVLPSIQLGYYASKGMQSILRDSVYLAKKYTSKMNEKSLEVLNIMQTTIERKIKDDENKGKYLQEIKNLKFEAEKNLILSNSF